MKISARDQIASFKRSLDFTLAAGHNFNRQILPYLKLFWPHLREPEPNSPETRLGLDFVAMGPGGRIHCGICCRVFKGGKPGLEPLTGTKETIRTLQDADNPCDFLLVVHNADGNNSAFNDRTAAELARLVDAGAAQGAEAWDRHTLISKASQKVRERLETAFRKNSTDLLYRQQSLFRFGRIYLPKIPVSDSNLAVRNFRRSSQGSSNSPALQDISAVLRSNAENAWTVLTGVDGAGKTAAVLHAARSQDKVVILIPSAALSVFEARQNVGKSLEDLARFVGVFCGFQDVHDQEMLYRLAGPVLADCLQNEKCPYVVMIDGLDENRPVKERQTVERLMHHLAGLRCQVVLTTPDAVAAKLTKALKQYTAVKDRPRWLSIEPWTKRQRVEIASQALRDVTGDERQHLAEFLVLLQNDKFLSVYGNLPSYPLFLHMILEQVAESGIEPLSQTQLLRAWVNRRIRRAFAQPKDMAASIGLLEDIAARMLSENAGTFEMAETLPSQDAQTLANRHFSAGSDSFAPLLLSSVLVPEGREANCNVSFAFETLQAYFTASYLVRENLPASGYPISVQSLYQELVAG